MDVLAGVSVPLRISSSKQFMIFGLTDNESFSDRLLSVERLKQPNGGDAADFWLCLYRLEVEGTVRSGIGVVDNEHNNST